MAYWRLVLDGWVDGNGPPTGVIIPMKLVSACKCPSSPVPPFNLSNGIGRIFGNSSSSLSPSRGGGGRGRMDCNMFFWTVHCLPACLMAYSGPEEENYCSRVPPAVVVSKVGKCVVLLLPPIDVSQKLSWHPTDGRRGNSWAA